MYIPEEKISDILKISDIVEVISESVILKKSGMNFLGLCPFHSEKTPSFSVSPGKQIFHCFGCSAGGNVFSFLMKYYGISYPEAVKMLAGKYNISIDTGPVSPEKIRKINLKQDLFRLNSKAEAYYSDILKNSIKGEKAKKYLRERGITRDIVEEFKIGCSPDAWESMVGFLKKERVPRKLALESGLILEGKQRCYDRFRNRVIFPIFDINMQIAGFGGRIMDDSMPKYLNSPETHVYSKSRILYGLHAAKSYCRQEGYVYIVEGYFDFLSLYQHGIRNTVASLGTALTSEHIRILKGYALKVILVFDSDAAGISAAERSIKIFMKEGVDIRVTVLPEGKDPDSYIFEYGKEAFEKLADKAKTSVEFLLHAAIRKHGLSVEGRMRILEDMKSYLILIRDKALRSLYIRDLSEKLGVSEKAILEKTHEHLLKNAYVDNGKEIINRPESDLKREEQIVSMILNYPELIDEIIKTEVLEYFYSDRLKKIAKKIISFEPDKKQTFIIKVMAGMEKEEDRKIIASLAMNYFFKDENVYQTALLLIQRIIKVRKKDENILINKIINAQKGYLDF